MKITIKSKSGESKIIKNTFPSFANSNQSVSFVLYGLAFIVGSIGFFSIEPAMALLFIPIFAFGILLSQINSGGGDSNNIVIDQEADQIYIGDKKNILSASTFLYHSDYYNNPITRGYREGDIMIVTIKNSDFTHTFKTKIDTFIDLKDELNDNLGIKMQKRHNEE